MDKYESKSHRVFDLIDNTEKYTPQEINEILRDPETRELYNLLCLTSSAVKARSTEEPDVDGEWAAFSKKQTVALCRSNLRSGSRAASIAVIIFSSIVAVAAGVVVKVKVAHRHAERVESAETVDEMSVNVAAEDSLFTPADTVRVAVPPVLYEDALLATIMDAVASAYGVEVKFNNRECADLRLYYRLDCTLPLDEIVSQLNTFEQINITRHTNILIVD